ncbi:MAG: hypothetical protein ACKO5C_05620 [Ferruginibacter sp.]
MKKFLFIAVLVAASFTGFSQTSKGTWLLGGGAGFNSVKPSGGSSTTVWNLSPRIGYFLANNLAASANVSIADAGNGTETTFGPAVRYYFTNLGSSAKLYGNVGANFGDNISEMNVAAGVAYFLNSSVALETAIGYSNESKSKVSSIGLNIGFQIHFKK